MSINTNQSQENYIGNNKIIYQLQSLRLTSGHHFHGSIVVCLTSAISSYFPPRPFWRWWCCIIWIWRVHYLSSRRKSWRRIDSSGAASLRQRRSRRTSRSFGCSLWYPFWRWRRSRFGSRTFQLIIFGKFWNFVYKSNDQYRINNNNINNSYAWLICITWRLCLNLPSGWWSWRWFGVSALYFNCNKYELIKLDITNTLFM